jgi:hypothetical protein
MDYLSLLIDFLKWSAKTLAAALGYQMGELEQVVCAVLILSLGFVFVGFVIRFFFLVS